MMMALKRSGLLSMLSGIIVGSMTDMHDNPVPFRLTAYEIIHSHVKDLGVPVCFGFSSGHIDNNLAWIHGKKIRLTVKNDQPVSLKF
jgi:muramoyltetrapeptide carboxypeptidase